VIPVRTLLCPSGIMLISKRREQRDASPQDTSIVHTHTYTHWFRASFLPITSQPANYSWRKAGLSRLHPISRLERLSDQENICGFIFGATQTSSTGTFKCCQVLSKVTVCVCVLVLRVINDIWDQPHYFFKQIYRFLGLNSDKH